MYRVLYHARVCHSYFQLLARRPPLQFLDFRVKLVFSHFSKLLPVLVWIYGFDILRFWFCQNAGHKRKRNKINSVEAKVRTSAKPNLKIS